MKNTILKNIGAGVNNLEKATEDLKGLLDTGKEFDEFEKAQLKYFTDKTYLQLEDLIRKVNEIKTVHPQK